MVDFLKKNLAIIVGLLLAWGGYSYLGDEEAEKTASAKVSLDGIPESALEMRDAEFVWSRVVDPFRFETLAPPPLPDATPAGGPGQAASKSGDAQQSEDLALVQADSRSPIDWRTAFLTALGTVRAIDAGLRRGVEHSFAQAVRAGKQYAAAAARKRARFTLLLESTLAGAGAGQARISGHTVVVGASMPFLDPKHPPVLESVSGGVAVVLHRTDRYVLDLNARRRINVGGPPLLASLTADMGPSGGSAPAAAPSVPKKTSHGYRIRGSNKRKR